MEYMSSLCSLLQIQRPVLGLAETSMDFGLWRYELLPNQLRLSRMDAAIDAMLPYGFTESHVRKAIKLLLKEYGGHEGWPFIEEFSYKELIEAILRDQEECDENITAVEHGNPQINTKDEKLAGTSGSTAEDSILEGAELLFDLANPTCQEVDHNKKGLGGTSRQKGKEVMDAANNNGEPTATACLDQTSTFDPVSLSPPSPPVNKLPTTRSLPHYAWIASDEEDPEEDPEEEDPEEEDPEEDPEEFVDVAPAVDSNPTPPSGASKKL